MQVRFFGDCQFQAVWMEENRRKVREKSEKPYELHTGRELILPLLCAALS